jgi:hypothetical protein
MTSRGGSLYIGTLTPFAVKVGAAEVFKLNPRTGRFRADAHGLRHPGSEPLTCRFSVERVTRIELALSAWESD